MRTLHLSLSLFAIVLGGCSGTSSYTTDVLPGTAFSGQTVLRLDLRDGSLAVSEDTTRGDADHLILRRIAGGQVPASANDAVGPAGTATASAVVVTLATIHLAASELTQAQWQRLVAAGGAAVPTSPWTAVHSDLPQRYGDDFPAYGLSRRQVTTALAAWNQRFNRRLALPNEAAWERAARPTGDTSQPFAWSSTPDAVWNTFAHLRGPAGDQTERTPGPRRVGLGEAAPAGFFDLHGNVWEWVADSPDATTGLLKGGSWTDNLVSAQIGNRLVLPIDTAFPAAGCRLALELP